MDSTDEFQLDRLKRSSWKFFANENFRRKRISSHRETLKIPAIENTGMLAGRITKCAQVRRLRKLDSLQTRPFKTVEFYNAHSRRSRPIGFVHVWVPKAATPRGAIVSCAL